MASIRIKASEPPARIAPTGIWFEAEVDGFATTWAKGETGEVYDPTFHDIHYTWRILTPEPWAFDAPGNMIPDWNDATRAHGKKVSLFFPEPGRFTVEVIARDAEGTEARAEYPVEIAPTDPQFPGEATLAVSFDPAETWKDAPDGALKIASVAELEAAIRRRGQPTRILFRRGQTFVLPTIRMGRAPLYHIDAWGAGRPPLIVPRPDNTRPVFAIFAGTRISQFTLANLDMRGLWDATTETGLSNGLPFVWKTAQRKGYYVVWGCRFSGFDMLDVRVKAGTESVVLLGNSTITNWRIHGVFFWGDAARLGLAGMQIAQHVNALHGGRLARPLVNRGGPLRTVDGKQVYIGTCDFFSRTGWSGVAGETADQPCLRLNTRAQRDVFYNVDRVVCEGGLQIYNMAGATVTREEDPGNYLLDKALLIGTAKTIGPFIESQFGGTTCRNVIGILPNTARKHPNPWNGSLRTGADVPQPGNLEAPVALYNSTFLDLRGEGDSWKLHVLRRNKAGFQNQTLENNLVGEADLAVPIPGVTPRYRGIRYGFQGIVGTLERAIPNGDALYLPYEFVRQNTPADEDTPATDQAYWQANAERDVFHAFVVGNAVHQAVLRQIRVAFTPEHVVIQNTSGATWEAEARWALKLDRTSRLPAMDERFASPETLPLPYPKQNMPATGLVAFDDFFGNPRGDTPVAGALNPKS
ncbi:MAG: hypothetical protein AAGF55_00760 [Pseudomonadota bacterium]